MAKKSNSDESKKKKKTTGQRSGLSILSTAVRKQIKKKYGKERRISKGASVNFAQRLDFLLGKVMECAKHNLQDTKTRTINEKHVKVALALSMPAAITSLVE